MKGATERERGGAVAGGGRQRQRQAKTDRDRRRYGDREADMPTHTDADKVRKEVESRFRGEFLSAF
jgi:hypothetical protein